MLIFLGDERVMSSRSVSLSADWVLGLGSHVGDCDVAAGDDGDEGDDDKSGDDGGDDDDKGGGDERMGMMMMQVGMMMMIMMVVMTMTYRPDTVIAQTT